MKNVCTKPSAMDETPATQSFWEMLRNSGRVFESSIKGISMEPTIPEGARVRIRPRPADTYQLGQIVACELNDVLFAHRIVYCGSAGRCRDFVLTQGDGHVLCDPPTRKSKILGVIEGFWVDGAWRKPGPPLTRGRSLRAVSMLHQLLIRMCLPVHYEFARRVAGTSLILASLFRRPVRMIRRK
jgi:hypothetical protein